MCQCLSKISSRAVSSNRSIACGFASQLPFAGGADARSAAAMGSRRARASADSSVTVGQLQGCLRSWLHGAGNRDIQALLKPLRDKGVSWKTAPEVTSLQAMAPAARLLASVCRNGVVPTLKLVSALTELHAEAPVNFTHEAMATWGPNTGETMRMAMSKFRSLRNDPAAKIVCLKKATGRAEMHGGEEGMGGSGGGGGAGTRGGTGAGTGAGTGGV